MQRQCKSCDTLKDINDFEVTTKSGCRRAVCKPCYSAQKRDRAKLASVNHDPSTVPMPQACISCGKGPDRVTFKWRADVINGGWRSECNECYNTKGYSTTHRAKKMEEDPVGYRAHNAAVHLAWGHNNPEKLQEQKNLNKVNADRRFKSLVTYVRSKSKKSDVPLEDLINMEDGEAMQDKMELACHYCGETPVPGISLNGLDRVDSRQGYTDANTVPCCSICNDMKITFSMTEFIDSVRRIAKFHSLEDRRDELKLLNKPIPLAGTAERRSACIDKTDFLPPDVRLDMNCAPCYLCSRAPSFGVDRVDAKQGYITDNCKGCCSYCNYMKKDWKLDEFLAHVYCIYDFTKQWVMQDCSGLLNVITGKRYPLAPIKDGKPLLIFPDGNVAASLVGKGIECGYTWRNVPPSVYRDQYVGQDDAKRIIIELCAQQ